MDFSHVTSLEHARELVADGRLLETLLFPFELGGEARPENVVFVPPEVAGLQTKLTASLGQMFQDELIDQVRLVPEYRGKSFIPAKISVSAWHSQKPGRFERSIRVW